MLLLALLLAVNGTVTSIDGAAIPGARVVAVNAAQVEVVTTDARGAFVLTTVELPFDLEVSAPGFATVRTRVTAAPVEIVLSPAGVTASVIVTGGAGYGTLRATDTGDTILSGNDVRALPGETLDESLQSHGRILTVPAFVVACVEPDDARRHDARIVGVWREPRSRAVRRRAAQRRLRRLGDVDAPAGRCARRRVAAPRRRGRRLRIGCARRPRADRGA